MGWKVALKHFRDRFWMTASFEDATIWPLEQKYISAFKTMGQFVLHILFQPVPNWPALGTFSTKRQRLATKKQQMIHRRESHFNNHGRCDRSTSVFLVLHHSCLPVSRYFTRKCQFRKISINCRLLCFAWSAPFKSQTTKHQLTGSASWCKQRFFSLDATIWYFLSLQIVQNSLGCLEKTI